MKNSKLLLLFTLVSLTMIACNPESLIDPDPTPAAAANPTPTFNDADAVLASIQTLSYQSANGYEFSVAVDVAVAAFFETSASYYPAGLVSINTNDLEMNDNNSYTSVSATSANIDLGLGTSGNVWSVAGATNVSAFNHTTSRGMPSDVKFSAAITKVNTANTLNVAIVSAPTVCDSILYLVAGNDKTVSKIVARTVTNVDFTTSELSGFTGTGVVQVAPYNFEFSVEGGKKIYYINEKVITSQVEFE